ncbi:MAG: hypothetical protein ACREQ5_04465 [Candidatus Dormibacteria bacterium]
MATGAKLRVIERLGAERMVPKAEFGYPAQGKVKVPEGWESLGAGLRIGVYALVRDGKVVFVGKAKVPIELVAEHRDRSEKPSWWPVKVIEFDEVWIKPSHPDRVDAELAEAREKWRLDHEVVKKS